jgi:hypothetical protein
MLQAYISSAFMCFICMLQVFHVDVAYVAMVIHVCCKCIVLNVLAVSDVCCKCFIWVLHMFHSYVASIFIRMLHMFHTYAASVSSRCCICFAMAHVFSWCFRRMLQVFHPDIAKVDLMLHILQCDPSAAAACYSCWAHMHACGCGASDRCGKRCRHKSRWSPRVGAHRRKKRSGTGPHVKQAHACGWAW